MNIDTKTLAVGAVAFVVGWVMARVGGWTSAEVKRRRDVQQAWRTGYDEGREDSERNVPRRGGE